MTIETLITWMNVIASIITILYLFTSLVINKPKSKIKTAISLLVLSVIVIASTIFIYNVVIGAFQSNIFSGIFSVTILAVILIDRKNFLRNIKGVTLIAKKTMRKESNQ